MKKYINLRDIFVHYNEKIVKRLKLICFKENNLIKIYKIKSYSYIINY